MIKSNTALLFMHVLCHHKFGERIFAVTVHTTHESAAAVLVCNLFLLQTVIDHRLHCADALIGFWNKIYGCHYPFLAIFNSCS